MPSGLTFTATTGSGTNAGIERYLARQPIFDRRETVFGYELLLRSSLDNFFRPQNPERVSELFVDNYLLFGLETLTGGRRAFVNFNRDALVRDYASFLPKDRIVVEILEGVDPDSEVIAACERLKALGYLVALDDFVFCKETEPLIEYADIVKVDFLATSPPDRSAIARRMAGEGIKLLAEKVESRSDIGEGLEMGYTLFQGNFYCRPQMMTARDIPGFKPNYVRMLRAVNRKELSLREIELILKQEPSLLFKLLRYLNSAYFYLCQEVTSIRHALALLGEDNIRKWTFVVALVELARDKPDELIVLSLTRARFCELLAAHLGLRHRETDLFLLGMLSCMDAVVGSGMESLLKEIPVAEDVKAALMGMDNHLRRILQVPLGYERGAWQETDASTTTLDLEESILAELYLQSIEWTRRVFRP